MTVRSLRLVPVLMSCAALAAHAQGTARGGGAAKECVLDQTGVTVNGQVTTSSSMRGVRGGDTTWFGGGVDFKCEGTDQRVLSDSAEHYTEKKLLILIGHVHYTESRLKLDADRITYFMGEERLLAEGNVVGVTNTGTRFIGPRAEYWRPAVGLREKSHLVADPRANLWVSPNDAGAGSKDSVNVQADRIIMDNDSLIFAKGSVVIERPDLLSTSDSAFVDKYKEFARLTLTPKVVGRGDRHFTLDGDIIDVFSKDHQVDRVKSLGHAFATSDEIVLKADTIDLRVTNQKLEEAFAWGRSRAHAHSKDQDITADSIHVSMPGQTLQTMWSVGRAIAESSPDTLKITSKVLDRLEGETIIAHFDTLTAADTVKQPALKQIFAKGTPSTPATARDPAMPGMRAKSFYQVARSGEKTTDRPNVNYTLADSVTVVFQKRQVYQIHFRGHVEGFYDELAVDTTKSAAAKDSATAKKPAKKPAEKKP